MKTVMISALIVLLAIVALSTFGAGLQTKIRKAEVAPTSSDAGIRTSKALQLAVSAEKESFSVGEPIMVAVSARNNGRKVLVLENTYHPEWDYKLDVRNEAGESVALTEDGKRLMKDISIYQSATINLNPGEDVQKEFRINKLFEMTTPGTYSITVKRVFYVPDTDVYRMTTSNTVKVTVAD